MFKFVFKCVFLFMMLFGCVFEFGCCVLFVLLNVVLICVCSFVCLNVLSSMYLDCRRVFLCFAVCLFDSCFYCVFDVVCVCDRCVLLCVFLF